VTRPRVAKSEPCTEKEYERLTELSRQVGVVDLVEVYKRYAEAINRTASLTPAEPCVPYYAASDGTA
jgi:predicted CoA-binding protein